MANLETLQTRLDEAEGALHNLTIGSRVVDVWRDGRRVKYSESNKSDLIEYIAWLKGQIFEVESEAAGLTRRRPTRIYYA